VTRLGANGWQPREPVQMQQRVVVAHSAWPLIAHTLSTRQCKRFIRSSASCCGRGCPFPPFPCAWHASCAFCLACLFFRYPFLLCTSSHESPGSMCCCMLARCVAGLCMCLFLHEFVSAFACFCMCACWLGCTWGGVCGSKVSKGVRAGGTRQWGKQTYYRPAKGKLMN